MKTHNLEIYQNTRSLAFELYRIFNNYRRKTLLVSYPKCGRTWLLYMFKNAIRLYIDSNCVKEQSFRHYYWKFRTPVLLTTHDGTGDGPGGMKSFLDIKCEKKHEYKNKKVIFLIRNPRDVIVSFYFHRKKRSHPKIRFNGTIQEFIRSEYYGVKSIISFYNMWHLNMQVPRDFLLVRYEDIHESSKKVLKAVLDFSVKLKINDEIVDKSIKLSTFDEMRKREIENAKLYGGSNKLKPGNINDLNSYKVRNGKICNYAEYLSNDDLKYLDEEINGSLSDFYWFYKGPR